MLILARRVGESIIIGDQIEVAVVDLKGDQVKLGITAPREVAVYRREVYQAIQEENRRAAAASGVLPQLGLVDARRRDQPPRQASPRTPPRRTPPAR